MRGIALNRLEGGRSGRQSDSIGNLREWWDADVKKRFDERAQCIIKQYGKFEVSPIYLLDVLRIKPLNERYFT